MVVKRHYDTKVGSETYREIMQALNVRNAERSRAQQDAITYRELVVEGMGLRDAFCGKIKTGTYTPSIERMEKLADYLGVRPEDFSIYVRKYALLHLEDPEVVGIFKLLATQHNTKKEAQIKKALAGFVRTLSKDS